MFDAAIKATKEIVILWLGLIWRLIWRLRRRPRLRLRPN